MRKTRVNHEIRLSPIKVIDQNEKMLGEMPTDRARQLAEAAGLDLVEINAEVRPPLCKITDYGKYKFELSKKKQSTKGQELKEVRLGRSMKIDDHDVMIRVSQARKFLMDGHKVQIVAQFRGREMAHKDKGIERLREICEDLGDIAKIETPLRSVGRRMNVILSPDKDKVTAIKRRLEAERQKAIAEGLTPEPEPEVEEIIDDVEMDDVEGDEAVETAAEEQAGKKGKKKPKGGKAAKKNQKDDDDDDDDVLARMTREMGIV